MHGIILLKKQTQSRELILFIVSCSKYRKGSFLNYTKLFYLVLVFSTSEKQDGQTDVNMINKGEKNKKSPFL